jgi:ribosomal protein S19
MSKSKWKGPFITNNLVFKNLKNENLSGKFWNRNLTVLNSLIDKNIHVYNGKIFKKIFITREKLGFKVGDFCFSRNYVFKKIIKKPKKKK